MSKGGFLKKQSLLNETYKVDDWFDLNQDKVNLEYIINSINKPSILGYVGVFGIGKSTLIHQIQKNSNKREDLWINFDAWKYPNRDNLWEGFVLDFAKKDSKLFRKTLDKINGEQNRGIVELIKVLFKGGSIIGSFYNPILSNLSFGEKFKFFFRTSPAKRVFEIQEILNKIIKKENKNLFFVIEDIDRSGDKGIYFLETLNQYLKNFKDKKRIIVIVPISKEHFFNNQAYLKCLDYIEFFNPGKPDLSKLINKVFHDDYLLKNISESDEGKGKQLEQIKWFLENLFTAFSGVMTPRLLKLIIRNAEKSYLKMINDGLNPDWRVTIMIESLKFIKFNENKNGEFQKIGIEVIRETKEITNVRLTIYNEIRIYLNFLNIIASNLIDDKRILENTIPKKEFKFVNDNKMSTPEFKSNLNQNIQQYELSDFYLKY
ncbi:MAG: hypothetical protein GF332_02480 [Candidatus Moranbacteria bacterium]|nr:hypothetical protein [Candidatus Moranbacteria bacterium]